MYNSIMESQGEIVWVFCYYEEVPCIVRDEFGQIADQFESKEKMLEKYPVVERAIYK